MTMICAHEIPPGETRCIHCNAVKPGPDVTCIHRPAPVVATAPEPTRRIMACEDASIADRIAELRAEREAAWNRRSDDT